MTVILGGGISGLSAAYYGLLNKKITSLTILEASNRVGGWIRSKQLADGSIFEQGPRTIRPGGPAGINTLNLVAQLELSDKVVPLTYRHTAAKSRLVYRNEELHLLPNTLKGVIKKNSLLNRSLLSLAWNDLRAPKVSKDDESLYSFVERRLGTDVADYLISPLICGICAGDARQISVNFLMKSFFEGEQKHGSIIKGVLKEKWAKRSSKKKEKNATAETNAQTDGQGLTDYTSHLATNAKKEGWVIWGMKGGLEEIPLALASNLSKRGVSIKTEHKCEQIKFKPDHVELIVNGKTTECSNIVSSLPAQKLANLVHEQHPQLARELQAIPTVTVGVVNLQFPKDVCPLNAFGFLVPPKEELPILGVIFDSAILPCDSTVLTVMMGGAWFEKYFGKCPSDEHLVTVAVNHVRKILHIEEDPTAFDISVLRDCIPQYVVGHTQRLTRIRNYISAHGIPLVLCGSSYDGVGLNDVILSAKQAVSDISNRK